MWESPFEISSISEEIGRKIVDGIDGYIVEQCVKIGVNVDKGELLKALAYDRGQYEKGFLDGRNARDSEIVRCKDCKWFGKVGCAICIVDDYDKPNETDFCSFGERRDDEVCKR